MYGEGRLRGRAVAHMSLMLAFYDVFQDYLLYISSDSQQALIALLCL